MTSISKQYGFSAAHRIEGHPKCGRMHGHNYLVTVELEGLVATDGMVLDYNILDEVAKPIIDAMDHRYLVSRSNRDNDDPYLLAAIHSGLHAGDIYDVPKDATTAERLAEYFAGLLLSALSREVALTALTITVKESDKTSATFRVASKEI